MKERFVAVLEVGHKGCAVIVPFDPAVAWGREPEPIPSPVYGKEMPGHPVRGTKAGVRFTGWVGHRWKRHFLLVDEDLRRAAGAEVGDEVAVVIEPVGKGPRRPKR